MAFLMNHGEKIVAAVFAMLGCLALSSANWATTDKSPLKLENDAKENEAKIELNDWPAEEKVWFEQIPDVITMTSEEGRDIVNVAEYQMRPFNIDLTEAKEKRSGVIALAPESPKAVSVVFPLAMPPEEEDTEDEAAGDEKEKSSEAGGDEPTDEEAAAAEMLAQKFGLRPAGADGTGSGAMAGMAEGGLPGSEYDPAMTSGPGYSPEEMAYNPEMPGGEYGYDMAEAYGQGMMTTKKNIRVAAGVAATMIIDLRKQRDLVRNALHLTGSYQVVQQEIKYIDLIVERRTVGDTEGPWEPVTKDDLAEILKESIGTDRDIVSPAVTRNAITQPLPRRAAGLWQPSEVSHPRVEDFELSREEKELIDKWNQKVKEKLAEEQEAVPQEVEVRGFADFVQTPTDYQTMYGSGEGIGMGAAADYTSMYTEYEASMGSDGRKLTAEERQLLDATMASADHRLLLVRFLDFTVERGTTYQYRARIAMKNPNFNHPLDELEDPALAAEPEILSDWSEPTNKVSVSQGYHTYLAEVDARPGQQEEATIRIYTDTTETGLSVMGPVNVLVGMPVAGKDSLEVVDLRDNTVEDREVTLRASQLLAAAEELGRMSSSDHPELKPMLSKLNRSVKPIPDEICVIDSDGAIKLRSTGDMTAQETADAAEYKGILELYESWKKKAATAESDFFGPGSSEAMMMEEGAYGLGMEDAASTYGDYYGGGPPGAEGGKRMSSRERARQKRQNRGQGGSSSSGSNYP